MPELDYEQGLKGLEDSLPPDDSQFHREFFVLKARLLKNLDDGKRYGIDEGNRADYARIMDGLGELADKLLGVHFIDLCQYNGPAYSPQPDVMLAPKPPVPNISQSWTGGAEIVVQDKTYWLHDPIEEQWASDRSVVQRKAKAQQAETNRKVWLKQVCMLRSTAIADTWQNGLRREGRLLQELEQEPRSSFPRLITLHGTEQGVTISYTVTGGRPLAEVFGLRNKPLDAFSCRTLLRNIYSLCGMLGLLHRRNLAHRALTPETILVQRDGRLVLQDVGLAAQRSEPGEGPQLYQAPEQVRMTRGLSVPGPHTDIYQLGRILYHIVTGHLPSTPLPDVPPGDWNGALSQNLYGVLQRATAPDAQDRWSSIRAFSNALRQAAKSSAFLNQEDICTGSQ